MPNIGWLLRPSERHKKIKMSQPPNDKRKHIIKWLIDLRTQGRLHCPVHTMNVHNWFLAYQREHQHLQDASFNDIQYFNLHMNKIANYSMFEGQ